jgi:hypothetical protein
MIMALPPAAEELMQQVKASGYTSRRNELPTIIEDVNRIAEIIQSKSSCYWNAGEEIPGTDAVVLCLSMVNGFWSACSKADFAKAKEIAENTLTEAGQ